MIKNDIFDEKFVWIDTTGVIPMYGQFSVYLVRQAVILKICVIGPSEWGAQAYPFSKFSKGWSKLFLLNTLSLMPRGYCNQGAISRQVHMTHAFVSFFSSNSAFTECLCLVYMWDLICWNQYPRINKCNPLENLFLYA